jgi:hypothetical protein
MTIIDRDIERKEVDELVLDIKKKYAQCSSVCEPCCASNILLKYFRRK